MSVRKGRGFRWEGVDVHRYKEEADAFRAVTRQTLAGAGEGLASELRYFEVGPGGWTTLERHRHAHAVVVIRGRGRALVGREIHDLAPFDVVHVPPSTWHQLRAAEDEPLGFLCAVDAERDRPERPGEADLAELCREPGVEEFVRA